jgi:hypothetical protein
MGLFLIAALGVFICSTSAMAAPPAPHISAPHASAPRMPAMRHVIFRNPHLHGANNPVAEHEAHHIFLRRVEFIRHLDWRHRFHFYRFAWFHHWHHHWDYVSWVRLHRGLASIEGVVTSASGQPVAGATVQLRGNLGRVLGAAESHITTTDGGGNFTMTGIRVGAYRLRTELGKAVKVIHVDIHAGQVASVQVRV